MAFWPWSRKASKSTSPPDLRGAALSRTPAELGLKPTPALPNVFGLFMEWALPNGVATLVTFAEGSTSLYFSGGGGFIGAGQHDTVRQAATRFLKMAEEHLSRFTPAADAPLPPVGRVTFVARTYGGTLRAEGPEADMGHNRDPLSPLFHAGQSVITEIRKVSSK